MRPKRPIIELIHTILDLLNDIYCLMEYSKSLNRDCFYTIYSIFTALYMNPFPSLFYEIRTIGTFKQIEMRNYRANLLSSKPPTM